MGYKNTQLGNSEVNNTKYPIHFNNALRQHFSVCNLINFIMSLPGRKWLSTLFEHSLSTDSSLVVFIQHAAQCKVSKG